MDNLICANCATTVTFPIEKKLKELMKMEKKFQKLYVTYYSLLIVQELWQVHYQILSLIFLKELIELNVNSDAMIKNVKHVELNICFATVFVNIETLKMT